MTNHDVSGLIIVRASRVKEVSLSIVLIVHRPYGLHILDFVVNGFP